MSGIFTKVFNLPVQFPLVRGMVSYAVIWPTCSIVQEYIEHGTTIENADLTRAARFGFFGTFFMAPVFYGWMKYTSRFFKQKNLITAVTRAVIEQVSYSPLAMAYFFFGMSMLEMKPLNVCVNEVKEKFWPTYKIGVVFWPTAQTVNFYFVSEKNRIVFVSLASFVWTIYLAHMKAKEQQIDPEYPKKVIPLQEYTEKLIPVQERAEKFIPVQEHAEEVIPDLEHTEKVIAEEIEGIISMQEQNSKIIESITTGEE